jgi:hypothetical protein
VLNEYLAPGAVRRTLTDGNLARINTDADRFMKVDTRTAMPSGAGSPVTDLSMPGLIAYSVGTPRTLPMSPIAITGLVLSAEVGKLFQERTHRPDVRLFLTSTELSAVFVRFQQFVPGVAIVDPLHLLDGVEEANQKSGAERLARLEPATRRRP